MHLIETISIPKDKKINNINKATEKAISQMTKKFGVNYNLLKSREKVIDKKVFGLKKKIVYEFQFSYEKKKDSDFVFDFIKNQETKQQVSKLQEKKNKDLSTFKDLVTNQQKKLGINQPKNYNFDSYNKSNLVKDKPVEKIIARGVEESDLKLDSKKSIANSNQNENFINNFRNISNNNYWESFLRDYDFSKDFIDYILKEANILSHLSKEEIYERFSKIIVESISYFPILKKYDSNTNLIVLLGPTGVGKTTTLQKIASNLHFDKEDKVLICSFDSVKLGAFAQLKAFADVTEVNICNIHDQQELLETYHNNKNDYDYIFVDSPGISSQDNERLTEMISAIESLKCQKEIYLCLAASWRHRELKKIYSFFLETNFNAIIVTKLDESTTLGAIMSLLWEKKIPISFLTDSQEVTVSYTVANQDNIYQQLKKDFLMDN